MTRLAVRHAALHVRVGATRASPVARAGPQASYGGGGALPSTSSCALVVVTGGGGGSAWGRRWLRRHTSSTRVVTADAAHPTGASDASEPSAAAAQHERRDASPSSSSLQPPPPPPPPPLPKVLVIAGPTAVGKTSLSLRMARALGGEIVSADSVQVYRGLDVGSSKLPEDERQGVVHHLLDVLHPSQEFGAGDFCERATAAIDHIVSKGKVPIVVGGTGLYLRWLVGGKPPTPPSNPEAAAAARAAVKAAAEAEKAAAAKAAGTTATTATTATMGTTGTGPSGNATAAGAAAGGDGQDGAVTDGASSTGWRGAVKLLAESGDPRTAARLAENDWYRMERAMEIVTATGRPVGDFRPAPPPPYDFRCVVLTMPRVRLYRRIDERVEMMVRDGMLEEAAGMLAQGIPPGGSPAARAIGYRQAMDFLSGLAARRQTGAGAGAAGGAIVGAAGGGAGGTAGTSRTAVGAEINERGGGDGDDVEGGAGDGNEQHSSSSSSSSSVSLPCTHPELLEFVEETQRATRAFAKRQFTWFRGEKDGLYTWISAGGGSQSQLEDAVLDIFHREDPAEEPDRGTDARDGNATDDAAGDADLGDPAGGTGGGTSSSSGASGGGGPRNSPLVDAERGEVDKETAQELKRYRPEQKLVTVSHVSEEIRARVDRLAADLAGSISPGGA